MAGVLYNIGSTVAGDARQERRQGLLQQGVSQALGTVPGLFDQSQDLFPGEAPTPGLETAGTGLLADPTNRANQLRFAANVIGLPGGQKFGQSILRDSLKFGEDAKRQQSGFSQQNEQQQRGFEFTGQQNDRDRQQRALIEAAKLEQKNQSLTPGQDLLGSIPSGFSRKPLTGGGFADVPNPGSVPYVTAVGKISALEQSIGAMDELITSAKGGGDFFGVAAGKQGILYENAVALIGVAFDKGVLQKEEREQIQDKLTDPTSLNAFFVSDERMEAEYNEVLRILQRKLGTENQKYALWGIGSNLANTTPAQQREIEKEAREEAEAAALGLTISPEPIPRQ